MAFFWTSLALPHLSPYSITWKTWKRWTIVFFYVFFIIVFKISNIDRYRMYWSVFINDKELVSDHIVRSKSILLVFCYFLINIRMYCGSVYRCTSILFLSIKLLKWVNDRDFKPWYFYTHFYHSLLFCSDTNWYTSTNRSVSWFHTSICNLDRENASDFDILFHTHNSQTELSWLPLISTPQLLQYLKKHMNWNILKLKVRGNHI